MPGGIWLGLMIVLQNLKFQLSVWPKLTPTGYCPTIP